MHRYQRLLRDLHEPSDWQAEDKNGRPLERLAYWRGKGRYGDETVRSLAELVCDEGAPERLTPDQLGELAFLLECAVRGKVTGRSLEAWLTALAEPDDRRGADETLRAPRGEDQRGGAARQGRGGLTGPQARAEDGRADPSRDLRGLAGERARW